MLVDKIIQMIPSAFENFREVSRCCEGTKRQICTTSWDLVAPKFVRLLGMANAQRRPKSEARRRDKCPRELGRQREARGETNKRLNAARRPGFKRQVRLEPP